MIPLIAFELFVPTVFTINVEAKFSNPANTYDTSKWLIGKTERRLKAALQGMEASSPPAGARRMSV